MTFHAVLYSSCFLIICPQVPSASTTITTTEDVATSTTGAAVDGAMAEIPFVPAALRQTVKAEVVDDTIVVVGQRQKKRKRSKKAEKTDLGGVETPPTPTEDTKAGPEDIVPFDFASAPNILDDVPSEFNEQEGGRAGKRRRAKKRSGEFSIKPFFLSVSNFGRVSAMVDGEGFAAPGDRRGVKSGNVTHTFRS